MKIIEILYKDNQRTAIRYSDGVSEKWVYADIKEEWDRFVLENKAELKKFDGEWFHNQDIIDTERKTKNKRKFPLYAKIFLAIVLLFLCSGCIFHYVMVRGGTSLLSNGMLPVQLDIAMMLIAVVLFLFYNLDEIKTWKTKRKVFRGFSGGIVLLASVFLFLVLWAFVWHWLFPDWMLNR